MSKKNQTEPFQSQLRLDNLMQCIVTNDVNKEKGNFYYHSEPPSAKYYDSDWGDSKGLRHAHTNDHIRTPEMITAARIKYSLLLAPRSVVYHNSTVEFDYPVLVLDACAGHGGGSLALVDMGAGAAVMCDGSGVALKATLQTIDKNGGYEKYQGKIAAVQADIENIGNVFQPRSFDIVFQRYAIMHMRNPLKTVRDLALLVKPGGMLCFNYYSTDCTPQIIRDYREYFLKQERSYVKRFFMATGYVDPPDQIFNLKDLLNGTAIAPQFDDIIIFLKKLCETYSIDEVEKQLHYENSNTPYLHNINPIAMEYFAMKGLGLELVETWHFKDAVSCTFRVPFDGVKEPKHGIPEPHVYSSEDVNLGDSLIKMINEVL